MSTKRLSIIVLVYLSLAVCAHADVTSPRVKTPVGKLKGYYKTSSNGKQYEAYEGIPYAYPPVGKLRFQPPRALPSWVGELSATVFESHCLQYNLIMNTEDSTTGSEDCLYLNIYAPVRQTGETVPKTLMPVFFWIHGGAFQFGSGNEANVDDVMNYDIIFVTVNYRLGLFGFLSTEDEVVPGNMGLKDQSLALRWVSENIEWFGGNPEKLTIIGMSAGAASVHYHYLSPMSAELFQGGISISGTALNCWAQDENSLSKTKQIANLLGCPIINSREMIRCLRFRPARSIITTMSEFMPFYYNVVPFGPVVEKYGDAPFIDRTPVEIISSGDVQDVPWITSVVSDEGLFPIAMFFDKVDVMNNLNDHWDTLSPLLFNFNRTIPGEKLAETARRIRKHYLGTKTINKANYKPLVQIASHRYFFYDSVKAAKMQAKVNRNPVWYYYYSYRSNNSVTKLISKSDTNYGVCHGDDIFNVLKTPWINSIHTQNDRDMQKHLIEMWISFATNGTPSVAGVEWLKVNPSKKELQYLHFANPTKIYMDSNADLGNREFWDSIDFNENKLQHTPTYTKVEL